MPEMVIPARRAFIDLLEKINNLYVVLAGDYASAIETLVTAISLLKQSRVAADDRCKILITSLQDTLNGVESRSYGGGRRDAKYKFVNFIRDMHGKVILLL
jgi:hypothetical protein